MITDALYISLAVAPVVPELCGDDDTTNFDDISDGSEGGNETFATNIKVKTLFCL